MTYIKTICLCVIAITGITGSLYASAPAQQSAPDCKPITVSITFAPEAPVTKYFVVQKTHVMSREVIGRKSVADLSTLKPNADRTFEIEVCVGDTIQLLATTPMSQTPEPIGEELKITHRAKLPHIIVSAPQSPATQASSNDSSTT